MRIIALVGSSGTGKSYRAIGVAYEKNISYIIDDGLLIKGNKIIAGKSAKRQKTTIGAVKTALFTHEDHKKEVQQAIKEANPKGLLILGTSKRMVDRIAKQLGLKEIQEYINIEEITTEEERKVARKQRHELGKHVIPVPTFEIKKDFSGYFIDPLKILRRKKGHSVQISEKSIVRPTFSYMGNYTISDKVIIDLVHYSIEQIQGAHKAFSIDVINVQQGIAIDLNLSVMYGYNIQQLTKSIQRTIKKEVESMTALNLVHVNICVKKIVFSQQ